MDDQFMAFVSRMQERNAANGIGGVLIYNGLNFIETLEGTPAAVERAFERVSNDTHQSGVRVIDRMTGDARLFNGWSYVDAERLGGQIPPLTHRLLPEKLERAYRSFMTLSAR
jgi:hypothetical protein